MNKLWIRLALAFGLVTLAGIVVATVFADRQVANLFRRYVARSQILSSAIATDLAEYYAQRGSWAGVDRFFSRPRLARPLLPQPTLILTDVEGRILYDGSHAKQTGQQVPPRELENAQPIQLEGHIVGYLIALPPSPAELGPLARAFLSQLLRFRLQAIVIAGLLGVFLGIIMARELSAPLGQLAFAARRISQGDFSQRVSVAGTEEVADLAQAFNEMAAALQRAEQLRREMVADIAHELRTPLTVLQGNLQAILDGVYPLDEAEIAAVYEETLMLSRLVNDLYELAQAEAGQLSLEIQPVDIGKIVEGVVGFFAESALAQGIVLEAAVPAHLPPALADPDRVRQVLHNLLTNALRYTPAGGRVTIECAVIDRLQTDREAGQQVLRSAGRILVRVTDTGVGIPEEAVPYVFERFWRVDKSRSREHGGVGLGLAVARHLIEAQGGQIGVESTVGRGSQFWFTLPAD